MKLTLIIAQLVVGACWLTVIGQNSKLDISGLIVDTAGAPLPSATVVLLNAADSVIVTFAITDGQGTFRFKRVDPASYILQATYVGYRTYSEMVDWSTQAEEVVLAPIQLESEATALGEVLVKADRIPLMIKKDTIEYSADAFKPQPTDVVEDLLRKLPGVEVEQDGTVKAQGEEVQQILVDGKEFFGRDPQIATKNLPAKAVDKVQVFDKKSEMAEFTGIDDGQEEKAINIELKEDYKNGTFGNLEAGYGTEGRNDNKLNLNKFSKNQQISFIGMLNNVNKQGFSLNDYVNFSGGLSNLMQNSGGGGRVQISGATSAIPLSQGLSNGFVNTGAGGINLNQDFGKKTELNLSYFYSDIRNDIVQEVRRENILSEESFLSEENEDQLRSNANHRINTIFEHRFDSTQNIKVRANLSFNNSNYEILSNSQILGPSGLLQNTGFRDNQSEGDNTNFSSEIIYRKKFAKRGRTLSIQADLGNQDDDQMAILQSDNAFFGSDGSLINEENIWQDQAQRNDEFNYGVDLNYTEPVAKNKFIGIGYQHLNNQSELARDVFDRLDDQLKYNSNLSNHYQRDYSYDKGDLSLRWIRSSSNINFGVSLQNANLQGDLLLSETTIERKFTNLLPRLTYNLDISNSKRLRLNYNTNVREPSLTQLQPIIDNSNPLNIYVGNPDLQPEYSHRLSLRYMSFSQFSMTNVFVVINGTYTDNAIVNARQIDEQFRQVTTPVNVENDYRVASFLGFGTPIKFLSSRMNIHANYSYNRGRVFVNRVEELTDRFVSSIDLSFDNQQKDILDLSVGGNLRRSNTLYATSANLNQDFLNQNYYVDLTVTIKNSWVIGSKLNYGIYSGGTLTSSRTIPLWEASIAKYLFKHKGQLRISAFDLLNRNFGIEQNLNLNYLEDTRIQSLGQYFMVSFTYALNELMGKSHALPSRGMHMIRRGGRR